MEFLTGTQSRRRATRASLGSETITCELHCQEIGSDWLSVENISEAGARVRLGRKSPGVRQDQTFEARLIFENRVSCSVRVRIVHVSTDSVGLEFIEPSSHLRSLVKYYYQPELVGARLQLARVSGKSRASVLSYQDGRENRIDILIREQCVSGLTVWIPELETQVEWMAIDDPKRPEEARPQARIALRIIHNLRELDPETRRQIERFLLRRTSTIH